MSILNLKGLFFIRALLEKAGRGISNGVSFALLIVYVEVILRKLLDP